MRAGKDQIAVLKRRVSAAKSISDSLVYEVIEATCPRYPNARTLSAYARLRRLIGAGAWLDVAMSLIELRLPHWQIHQLYYEDGRWVSVLGLRWTPATWLGGFCIAEHQQLVLAVIAAFIDAIERAPEIEPPVANVVPLRPPAGAQAVSPDHSATDAGSGALVSLLAERRGGRLALPYRPREGEDP